MKHIGMNGVLMAALGEALATAGPTPARAVVANPFADKLAQMAADKSKNKPKGTLEMEFDPARKGDLLFSISIEDLLKATGPSSTGTSNGLTLTAEGRFPFECGGVKYEFSLQMRGGWATIKAVV